MDNLIKISPADTEFQQQQNYFDWVQTANVIPQQSQQLQLSGPTGLTKFILQVTVQTMEHLNLEEQFYEKFIVVATPFHEKIYPKLPKTPEQSEFLSEACAVAETKPHMVHSSAAFLF